MGEKPLLSLSVPPGQPGQPERGGNRSSLTEVGRLDRVLAWPLPPGTGASLGRENWLWSGAWTGEWREVEAVGAHQTQTQHGARWCCTSQVGAAAMEA